MTQAANWNTRWEVQKQHIVWREQFYCVKFNLLQKAYAHFRMSWVNKDLIIGANCTLADHVDKFGTVENFKKEIGDTAPSYKGGILNIAKDAKTVASWTIRAPFLVLALGFVIVRELSDLAVTGIQKVCLMLPGSVD